MKDLASPDPSFSTTARVESPPSPSLLGDLAALVADAGGVVVGVDLVEVWLSAARVDLTFHAQGRTHVEAILAALEAGGHHVRRVSDRTYLYHLGGTLRVEPKAAIRTRDDLSMAYTPGVARIAGSIAADPSTAWNLTIKGNCVAVISDGTAVLGLGGIGPLAALPVMEGKVALMRTFAGLNGFPLCVDTKDTDTLVEVIKAVAPSFGAINLEDIAAPACFEVEQRLRDELDLPVFHDDQHGTAVVVLAGLMNACRLSDRAIEGLRVVVVGIGAAGHSICRLLLDSGVKHVVPVDRDGPLRAGDDLPPHQADVAVAAESCPGTLEEALRDADALVAVSRPGSVDPAWLGAMAPRPIIFALANPEPEVWPNQVPRGSLIATGRSDLPNQVNNALCFPGIFRGTLDAGARRITPAMLRAAATALAGTVTDADRRVGVLIPSIFHPQVHTNVAAAVASAVTDADRRDRTDPAAIEGGLNGFTGGPAAGE